MSFSLWNWTTNQSVLISLKLKERVSPTFSSNFYSTSYLFLMILTKQSYLRRQLSREQLLDRFQRQASLQTGQKSNKSLREVINRTKELSQWHRKKKGIIREKEEEKRFNLKSKEAEQKVSPDSEEKSWKLNCRKAEYSLPTTSLRAVRTLSRVPASLTEY